MQEQSENPAQTINEITSPHQYRGGLSHGHTRGMSKKTLIIAGIVLAIILLGVIGFTRIRSDKEGEAVPSPTPVLGVQAPSPSPVPTIGKGEVKINVLNGTGIAREASFLKGILEGLAYTNIETGNAENEDNATTTVSFSERIPDDMKQEILNKLEGTYTKVEDSKTAPTGDFDIVVTTGARPGVSKPTPKPTSTPTPKVTPTPTQTTTPTGSPTPSPTPSPSPSPTPPP